MPLDQGTDQKASLYRMALPDHLCPYGLKSKALLEREGYEVADHLLETREETDAFKDAAGVETTPQTYIGGKRVGGYDALREHLGESVPRDGETTYRPVIVVFAVAFAMGLAVSWAALGSPFTLRAVEWFVAIAMTILGIQKLRDVEAFSTMFLHYDLLGRRWVRYAYLYPYGETLVGVLMIAGALTWISAPLALFLGGVGAISVFKAVYVEHRELKCACVGGDSAVPLGFVSLSENLAMVAMGLWMPLRIWAGLGSG